MCDAVDAKIRRPPSSSFAERTAHPVISRESAPLPPSARCRYPPLLPLYPLAFFLFLPSGRVRRVSFLFSPKHKKGQRPFLMQNPLYTNRSPLSLIPGPIVEEITTLRRYVPFAVAGLARTTAPISAMMLSRSFSSSKDTLPTGT